MSKRRLGRGLDALLSGPDDTAAPPESGIAEIALDQIVRDRYQPRRIFTEESLNELAASIRAQGLMQPIVVRPRPQGGYELIAGERRWRAARSVQPGERMYSATPMWRWTSAPEK